MSSIVYLDIGNSNTKWKFKETYFELPTSKFKLDKLPKSEKIWISNVSRDFLIDDFSNIFIVESQRKYKSLINSYKEPNLLGSDRWLAMIASYEKSNKSSFITIDIGSAVTIDVVDSLGSHQGGLIFPGLQKVRKSFDNFPLGDCNDIHTLGDSTQDAWSIGTLSLIVNAINLKINHLMNEFPDASVFISGGGFDEIKRLLKFSYEYQKNLVLDGLEFFADNMG